MERTTVGEVELTSSVGLSLSLNLVFLRGMRRED